MDIKKFNDELRHINDGSWSYGNEILYFMTQNPHDLTDKDKLSGAIWLIGRAYAASPQRRSYGTMQNNVGYINLEGKTPAKCPIWPVRTQDDGRAGFFDEIASEIKKHIESDEKFKNFIDRYSRNSKNPTVYSYDRSASDIKILTESIIAVLRYNLFLSESLEKFDEVPNKHVFNGNKVYCSNHISFSSKFLHFCFPNIVFIIDSFALNGGKSLFNGNETDMLRTFYDVPSEKTDNFENDVYELFSKDEISKIYKDIINDSSIKAIITRYKDRTRNKSTSSDDNSTIKDYIEHCVRSYLLGCHINKESISPINQIKYASGYTVESMPRLTDSVFLNIKAPISKKVKAHYASLKKVYKISYI